MRNYWLPTLTGGEKAWRKALHDGLASDRPRRHRQLPTFHTSAPAPAAASGFEVIFVPSWSVFDGRFVNNGWLQEAPDPITKLTWDNAALLSPATAKKLGVGLGDVISIERNGRKVEAAVIVQPGQADDTIVAAVGYGRTKVGSSGRERVSTRTRSGHRIRLATEPGSTLPKTGRTYPLARTQEFDYQEEPKLVSFQH